MEKNTPILLDDYFDQFIHKQIELGRYSSENEVIQAGLRLLEQQEKGRQKLQKTLIEGEESGVISNFDREGFLEDLHQSYRNEKL